MQLFVTTECRFRQAPDGTIHAEGSGRGHPFWKRYLSTFDTVTILGRLSTSEGPREAPAEGPGVKVHGLPDCVGTSGFVRTLPALRRALQRAIPPDAALIVRLPGMIGSLALDVAVRGPRPYGVELVGDPYDAFGPGAYLHPLRPIIRNYAAAKLRRECTKAAAIAYVTKSALQRRYPPGPRAHTTSYSSVELPDEAFAPAAHEQLLTKERVKIIWVGSFHHLYKAPDVLLDALAICIRDGVEVQATLVGDGVHLASIRQRAIMLGLADHVAFPGRLVGAPAVREALDRHDVFVLPSRQEGLPRAMLEAMARGLACVGTDVGGIPELLAPEDLVPAGDAGALAARIARLARDPETLRAAARRNLRRAADYHNERLMQRRTAFYEQVAAWTQAWNMQGAGGLAPEVPA